tara:strand:- start:1126 stop:1383 length:258 start_codon:yes stop_codon:yes gene_type:complete
MEQLKDIPEAKYAMDELMDRTDKAEQKLIRHKKESLRLLYKIIVDVSLLQTQTTDIYPLDRMQLLKKEIAMDHIMKLLDLTVKLD